MTEAKQRFNTWWRSAFAALMLALLAAGLLLVEQTLFVSGKISRDVRTLRVSETDRRLLEDHGLRAEPEVLISYWIC